MGVVCSNRLRARIQVEKSSEALTRARPSAPKPLTRLNLDTPTSSTISTRTHNAMPNRLFSTLRALHSHENPLVPSPLPPPPLHLSSH